MQKETLPSRERVRLALNHQEPDRVPIDITYTSVPYLDVRRQLDLPSESVKPDVWDRVKSSLDVIDKLGCDLLWVGLNGPSTRKPFNFAMDEYIDEWGVKFRKVMRSESTGQFEIHAWPLQTPSIKEMNDFSWPDPMDSARYAGTTDYFKSLH